MLCIPALRRYAGVLYSVIPLGGDVGWIDPKMLVAMILMRGFRWISGALIHHFVYLVTSDYQLHRLCHLRALALDVGQRGK